MHELQRCRGGLRGELVCECLHVLAQTRIEVGIKDGALAPGHKTRQRQHLVRGHDARKAEFTCPLRYGSFVRCVAPAVHEDDGDGVAAALARGAQAGLGVDCIRRPKHLARRADALVELQNLGMQWHGPSNLAVKDIRARLVADYQRIGEAASRHPQHATAPPLEQGVGHHGGTDFQRAD